MNKETRVWLECFIFQSKNVTSVDAATYGSNL